MDRFTKFIQFLRKRGDIVLIGTLVVIILVYLLLGTLSRSPAQDNNTPPINTPPRTYDVDYVGELGELEEADDDILVLPEQNKWVRTNEIGFTEFVLYYQPNTSKYEVYVAGENKFFVVLKDGYSAELFSTEVLAKFANVGAYQFQYLDKDATKEANP